MTGQYYVILAQCGVTADSNSNTSNSQPTNDLTKRIRS